MQYLRSGHAASPRTLIDILRSSAARFPESLCIDDGTTSLTYDDVLTEIDRSAQWLGSQGIVAGDRVGIHMSSGRAELYLAILSTLAAGAAYVPVDVDDPVERAALVFDQAEVAAIFTDDGLSFTSVSPGPAAVPQQERRSPTLEDDCWIIFTSGTTGVPKGVAVTHRSAAAFIDAESRLFVQDQPLGPGDRILAGLSVAFDASCEEMWLAWAHGACLVPAPRSLVRTGIDLGPWLVERQITVVSTVPTLAAMWPVGSLTNVRLLILGGEACPPELSSRLLASGRELWNTYGPTETTVVACAAPLTGTAAVTIGLPLDGWDLAVVGTDLTPVQTGEYGELVIGGVGLARYLDPAKDTEKFAPMPSLGWERAYRSGDVVRLEPEGLYYAGRVDDQVKIGGRRIELGEVDAALSSIPGVSAAAAAVKKTAAAISILVGYLVEEDADSVNLAQAAGYLREHLPAGVVPRLTIVEELPTRTSGKVDRAALPWPLTSSSAPETELNETQGWIADLWTRVLGAEVGGENEDFFALGGGSLAAAHVVTELRRRFPKVTVGDLYDRPRLADFASFLDGLDPVAITAPRTVAPVGLGAQSLQLVISLVMMTLTGAQWLTWVVLANTVAAQLGADWAAPQPWWLVTLMVVGFLTPLGRMAIAAAGCRTLLLAVKPGTYPRAGSVHLRLWAAERLVDASGASSLAGAGWMKIFARILGAKIGSDVDLHSLPPVTGMLTLGNGCSIEPEVDLAGHWIDGDTVHIGHIVVESDAVVGARCTLLPGTTVGAHAHVEAGSAVIDDVRKGKRYAGSPARKRGKRGSSWPVERPVRNRFWDQFWGVMYSLGSLLLAGVPLLSLLAGFAALTLGASWTGREIATQLTPGQGIGPMWVHLVVWAPLGVVTALFTFALTTVVAIRLLSIKLTEGFHPVFSRVAWQAWATERLMDSSRTFLFPLYASMLTPQWLRILGASVGKDVEASTVLLIPSLTTVKDGAFLADDTMVASYELGGGWMRIAAASIGKRAFLGNSGIAAAGRKVPKHGLVAVLSSAPAKAKAGTSWLGSPPQQLRRSAHTGDDARTYDPGTSLKFARGAVETLRLLPLMVSFAIAVSVLIVFDTLLHRYGLGISAAVAGLVLAYAASVALVLTVFAKWLCIGRISAGERPLWSSFVWRNELADTFVEMVAAPWFARFATGTPLLVVMLRLLGATIGRGSWLESYWLPEADLAVLGTGVTVSRGCVVQTHLFHDRVMQLDTVTLADGATLGPHCVALPASSIGSGTTIGPASLVMRGDKLPDGTRWQGNPIAPE